MRHALDTGRLKRCWDYEAKKYRKHDRLRVVLSIGGAFPVLQREQARFRMCYGIFERLDPRGRPERSPAFPFAQADG